jgi:hypothetical protein
MDGNDKQEVLKLLKGNGHSLRFLSEELKNDKEIVLNAVSNDGSALYFASKELKCDKDVVRTAMSKKVWVLQYASEKLQNDKELLLLLQKKEKNNMDFIKNNKKWYQEKMKTLESYIEQEIIEAIMHEKNKKRKLSKF